MKAKYKVLGVYKTGIAGAYKEVVTFVPEDQTEFSTIGFTGEIKMTVDNQAKIGNFKPSEIYELDFSRVVV